MLPLLYYIPRFWPYDFGMGLFIKNVSNQEGGGEGENKGDLSRIADTLCIRAALL